MKLHLVPIGRKFALMALALATVLVVAGVAEARTGGGSSSGSRGTRSFTPPPATNTAPRAGQPLERSMTQPGQSAAAAKPGAAAATGTQSRFGGFGGMLMGGLLGAGLFGLLSGAGFGGLAGMLGMLVQLALIGGLVWLALRFFRSRSQPAPAAATTGMPSTLQRDTPLAGPSTGYGRSAPAGGFFGAKASPALTVGPADFDAFERLLGTVQDAYGREDIKALREITTPEMISYLAEDLADNSRQGVRNEVSGAKLLQGDLSEAWADPDGDYASVAMRFSLIDATVERATGKLVAGDRTAPQEVTEVWTFRRPTGAGADAWKVSAIQQV